MTSWWARRRARLAARPLLNRHDVPWRAPRSGGYSGGPDPRPPGSPPPVPPKNPGSGYNPPARRPTA